MSNLKIRIPFIADRDFFDLIEDPFEALWRVALKKAKKKAYKKDAEYRRIEDLRDNGSNAFRTFLDPDRGLDMDKWTYQHDVEKRLSLSLRVTGSLMRLSTRPRHYRRQLRFAWQRVFRGYDDLAVWDFHSWHTTSVINILTELQKHSNGYPAGMTEEQWAITLKGLIDAFKAIKEGDELADGEHQRRIDFAFRAFATYYQYLWD
jgi:hypothetical protein